MQYLPFVDQVLLLGSDGSMLGLGSYQQLIDSGNLQSRDVHGGDDESDKPKPAEFTKVVNRRESDGRLVKVARADPHAGADSVAQAENRGQGLVQLRTYKARSCNAMRCVTWRRATGAPTAAATGPW